MTKSTSSSPDSFSDVVLAIHGGAQVLRRDVMSGEVEQRYLFHLAAALETGFKVLQKGGSAVDGVESAVRYLEDCPVFNSGKGAVLNINGHVELDAAIMDGRTKAAGSVACIRTVKNPISAARAVMEKSEHVLLAGPGADEFAQECGLEIVDAEYFHTDHQQQKLQEFQKAQQQAPQAFAAQSLPVLSKYGTVGAVALDKDHNLAAATSTGGIINKLRGRIGDSPLIGAGTYADNETCAVSATGHGEFFIRWVAAYDISAMMKYAGLDVVVAADKVINEKLKQVNGSGGVIALDAHGTCALPFNSEGMFRGCVTSNGDIRVFIFRN